MLKAHGRFLLQSDGWVTTCFYVCVLGCLRAIFPCLQDLAASKDESDRLSPLINTLEEANGALRTRCSEAELELAQVGVMGELGRKMPGMAVKLPPMSESGLVVRKFLIQLLPLPFFLRGKEDRKRIFHCKSRLKPVAPVGILGPEGPAPLPISSWLLSGPSECCDP